MVFIISCMQFYTKRQRVGYFFLKIRYVSSYIIIMSPVCFPTLFGYLDKEHEKNNIMKLIITFFSQTTRSIFF